MTNLPIKFNYLIRFNLPNRQSGNQIQLPNRTIKIETKSKNIPAITIAECSGCELRNIILYSGGKSKDKLQVKNSIEYIVSGIELEKDKDER